MFNSEINNNDLLRYSRHILLPEIDFIGQQNLLEAKVLLVGVGGLGSPVALYLAASGIGKLTIADFKSLDISNLQRQVVYNETDVGANKVDLCADRLQQMNSRIQVIPIHKKLEYEQLYQQVDLVDIVVDCSDNLTTQFAINKACVAHNKWLVSARVMRWQGEISVFHCGTDNSPCYYCLHGGEEETKTICSNNGVLSPLVGVMGSMQAIEVIKLIINEGHSLMGRGLSFDAFNMQWKTESFTKNPDCLICS
jgi:adenylyltransferase/sulfurtransferase